MVKHPQTIRRQQPFCVLPLWDLHIIFFLFFVIKSNFIWYSNFFLVFRLMCVCFVCLFSWTYYLYHANIIDFAVFLYVCQEIECNISTWPIWHYCIIVFKLNYNIERNKNTLKYIIIEIKHSGNMLKKERSYILFFIASGKPYTKSFIELQHWNFLLLSSSFTDYVICI